MRRIPILLLAIAWLWNGPTPSAVADCTAPELEFALRNAPTVFVGEVIEVGNQGQTADMRVLAVWKGTDLPERVSTNGRPAEGTDDAMARRYQPGATYLVIPHSQLRPFPDDGCTATRLFAPQGTLIPNIYQDAVGAERGRLPAPMATATGESQADSSISGGVFIAGAAAVLLLAVAVVWLRNSRRSAAGPPKARRSLAGALGGVTRRSGMRSVKRLRRSKSR